MAKLGGYALANQLLGGALRRAAPKPFKYKKGWAKNVKGFALPETELAFRKRLQRRMK